MKEIIHNVQIDVVPGASSGDKKYLAFVKLLEDRGIKGFLFAEPDDTNKVFRSNLMVEGQTLPLVIVMNDTVYSMVQVQMATVAAEKRAWYLPYLNELNERFSMLKYHIDNGGNIIVTCSVPSSDDGFEPGLLIALLDQVKLHLETNYKMLMQKIWQN